MTAVKVWSGGAWVDSQITEKVRVSGAWVEFSPGGVLYESIAWPAEPADTDENDGTQAYNMGCEFTVTLAVDCAGVRWRVPDTVADPQGGPHAVALWNVSESRVAYKEFTPVAGGYQDVLFDSVVAMGAGSSWTATVYTNHYVFRNASPVGEDSPSGNLVVAAARLSAYNGGAASAPYPGSTTSLNFYVSPLATVP